MRVHGFGVGLKATLGCALKTYLQILFFFCIFKRFKFMSVCHISAVRSAPWWIKKNDAKKREIKSCRNCFQGQKKRRSGGGEVKRLGGSGARLFLTSARQMHCVTWVHVKMRL